MVAGRGLRIAFRVLVFAACAGLSGCGRSGVPAAGAPADPSPAGATANVTATAAAVTRAASPQPEDPLIVVHTSAGDLKLRLFGEKSPQTVDNFLRNYVSRGFYDQTIFHHVEP